MNKIVTHFSQTQLDAIISFNFFRNEIYYSTGKESKNLCVVFMETDIIQSSLFNYRLLVSANCCL